MASSGFDGDKCEPTQFIKYFIKTISNDKNKRVNNNDIA